MKALIIIIIVLFFFLLIPVGVDGGYSGGALILGLKIGPLNIKLFPRKKKELETAKPKSPKKEKAPKEKSEKGGLPADPLDLIKLALDALSRFRRRLSIDYLRIQILVSCDDPFKTSMRCAAMGATLGTFSSLLDSALNIKERDFGVTPDFLSGKTQIDVWLTASLHILDIFYLAFAVGIQYLKLIIKQKRSKPKTERNEQNG